jgi:hypothetical protein
LKTLRTRTFSIALMLALFLLVGRGCNVVIKMGMTTEEGAEHALYELRHPPSTMP